MASGSTPVLDALEATRQDVVRSTVVVFAEARRYKRTDVKALPTSSPVIEVGLSRKCLEG